MNIPKAIEEVVHDRLVADAGYDPLPKIRVWHNLDKATNWDSAKDKEAPLVMIAFAPEAVRDDQVTMECTGIISCQTKTDDDRDHSKIATLYEKTHDTLRDIFMGFIGGSVSQSSKYNAFATAIHTATSNGIAVGGVSFDQPEAPSQADGYNSTGIGFTVHFAYMTPTEEE